jgi:hypothetical protein
MQYVKLNVWFFGNKHISSGYYLITGQTDQIGLGRGYTTTLELLKVAIPADMSSFQENTPTQDSDTGYKSSSTSNSYRDRKRKELMDLRLGLDPNEVISGGGSSGGGSGGW